MTAQATKNAAPKKATIAKSATTTDRGALVTKKNGARRPSVSDPQGADFRPLRDILKNRPRFALAAVREAAGLTQVQIAKAMGKEQSTVSRVESGEDWLMSTLEAYAKALGGEVEVSIRVGRHGYRVR